MRNTKRKGGNKSFIVAIADENRGFMNIYDVALRRLGTRSRTEAELSGYLADKGFEEEDINNLIREYKELGYLDDLRYCHEYMAYSYKKSKGQRRIATELKAKGVDPCTIDRGFETYEEEVDEAVLAYNEAVKILKSVDLEPSSHIPEKILTRIGRRLITLGYSSDLVYNVIGKLMRG